jgi:hypothetical protein
VIGSVRLVYVLAGLLLRAAMRNELDIDAWYSHAGRWFSGSSLQQVISEEGICSDVSVDVKRLMLSDETRADDVPDFADNVLIRLFAARQVGRMSRRSFWATLNSKHFRYNVSDEELFQLGAAEQLLGSAAGMPAMREVADKALGNLSVLRRSVRDASALTTEEGDMEETRYAEAKLRRFQLLLQEHL